MKDGLLSDTLKRSLMDDGEVGKGGRMKRLPLVSVIVPTRNSSRFIYHCLNSIKKQSYKNIELIVVDNNSTDKTKEIALQFTSKVYTKGDERSAQRNYGSKMSKGAFVLFIDSDMQLTNDVVKECVRSKGVAVIIPEKSFGKGFWAKCKALEKEMYIGDDDIEAPRFFEKKLFWSVGGWDEKMIAAEDWDLRNRIRKVSKITRIKVLIWHNEGKLTLLGTMKKKYYYAGKIGRYLKKYVHSSNRIPFLRGSLKKHVLLLLKSPIIFLGSIVLKFAELLAATIGYMHAQ